MPDGRAFVGMAGLKKALLSRPELFVTTTTEKLLTYALGRGLEYYDVDAVDRIVEQLAANNGRASLLISS